MEKQAHKGTPPYLGAALVGGALAVLLALMFISALHQVSNKEVNGYVGVLLYSPTCPHCHALIKYLDEKYSKVPILRTTDATKIQPYLKEAGVSWQGGVPIMAINADGTIYVISGFPAEGQMVDGYFYGPDREKQLCTGWNGTKYEENGKYLFCRLSDGTIIGNEHAVDWVMAKLR